MTADDAWGGDLPTARVRDLEGIAAPADPLALGMWPELLSNLEVYSDELASHLEGALSAVGAAGGKRDLEALQLVARVQQLRRELGQVEAVATRWLGLSATIPKTGVLPDGSTYEVRRGANRKGWNHDGWKHDARQAILKRLGLEGHEVVDADTGELVDLQGVLTWAQELHGSANPRMGNLRQLGLDPDDYCETFPGLWGVQVTPPEPPEDAASSAE